MGSSIKTIKHSTSVHIDSPSPVPSISAETSITGAMYRKGGRSPAQMSVLALGLLKHGNRGFLCFSESH